MPVTPALNIFNTLAGNARPEVSDGLARENVSLTDLDNIVAPVRAANPSMSMIAAYNALYDMYQAAGADPSLLKAVNGIKESLEDVPAGSHQAHVLSSDLQTLQSSGQERYQIADFYRRQGNEVVYSAVAQVNTQIEMSDAESGLRNGNSPNGNSLTAGFARNAGNQKPVHLHQAHAAGDMQGPVAAAA